MVFSKKWLRNHPKFLLHFLIHIDALNDWILFLEPTVYNNSYFGDGDVAIVLSDLQCNGYERSIVDCNPKEFGSFECPRSAVVGVRCQDSKPINDYHCYYLFYFKNAELEMSNWSMIET